MSSPDSDQKYWDLILAILCLLWSIFILIRVLISKEKRGSGISLRSDGIVSLPHARPVLEWRQIKKISFLPWSITIKGNDGTKFSVTFLHKDFEQIVKLFSLLVVNDKGSAEKAIDTQETWQTF